MTGAVVDANVILKLLVDQPMTANAREVVKKYDLTAPALILAEVANALLTYVRAGSTSNKHAARSLMRLEQRAIDLHPIDQALTREAFAIGLTLTHPIYDCFYLALARRMSAPFITADLKFYRKAAAAGFDVLNLAEISGEAP